MYSGLTLTRLSGRLLGAHQKIDRVARRHLRLMGVNDFPTIKLILSFEGVNGPDAIKRKSPSKDEPHSFYDPLDDSDTELIKQIDHHYKHLVIALKKSDQENAAFQAAWLSHAIVDGLTPAHHYPYEEKLAELRAGASRESQTTIKEKWVMKGDTTSEKLFNNWKAWGPRGLLMAHGLFELGFSAIIKPLRFSDARPLRPDMQEIEDLGCDEYFIRRAREVVMMDLFETYIDKGWTGGLARKLRQDLAPLMVKTVTLIWFEAYREANR